MIEMVSSWGYFLHVFVAMERPSLATVTGSLNAKRLKKIIIIYI